MPEPLELREAFLVQLTARLSPEMSPLEVDETVRELRAHLAASSAAFEELGLSSSEAMSAAIHKLGDPAPLELGLIHESRQSRPAPSALLIAAAGAIFGGVFLALGDYAIYLSGIVSNPSEGMTGIGMVVGACIGLALRQRPRNTSVAALRAALIVPTALNAASCFLNRGFPGAELVGVSMVTFGTAAAATAALTQIAIRYLNQRPTKIMA